MKTRRILPALCVLLLVGVELPAQEVSSGQPPPAAAPLRSAEEIEQLVGPIALYPDALIALILPASTAPADIVLAARHLRDFPSDRSQIEHRAWDESVKSLTHYAEVLRWMDENLQWTKQLGEAFAEQPADVMQAVQRLRARARAAGTLVDSPQQQVIAESQVIRIVPAQPDVIYVPHYEPEVVFVDRPVYYSSPFVSFGVGVAVGSWLAFDCDWNRHTIWVGNRHRRWTGHDWRRPVVPIAPIARGHVRSPDVRPWRPSTPPSRATVAVSWHSRAPVARPTSFGSTASRSYAPRGNSSEGRRETHSLPVANTLPRSFSVDSSHDLPGPRAVSSTPPVARSLPMARNNVATAPAPAPAPVTTTTASTPSARPVLNNGGNREYRSRQSQASTVRSLPTAPSIPMASSVRSTPVTGPVAPPAARTYSQSRSHAAPAAVPSLPMASSARSAPAATVAPAAAPATVTAPAPATAPARNADNDNRRGRRPDQAHEP